MLTLKRIGLTALLILIQPLKILVSIVVMVGYISAACGREFVVGAREIWSGE